MGSLTDVPILLDAQIEAARLKAAETGGAADDAEDAVRQQIEREDDVVMPTILSKEELNRRVQAQGEDLSDTLAPGVAKRVTGRPALVRVPEPATAVSRTPLPPRTSAATAADIKRRTVDEQQNVPPGGQEMSALHRKRKKTRGISGGGDAQGATFAAIAAGISPVSLGAAQAYDVAIPSNKNDDRQAHSDSDTISRRLRPRPVRGWIQ